MWTFLATALVCYTALALAHGARPLIARYLTAFELRLGVPSALPPVTAGPIPPDLVEHAGRWTDTWAREAELQAMREAYESVDPSVTPAVRWQRVRVAFGVGA